MRMFDKIIEILQIILPILILVKILIYPYLNKRIKLDESKFANTNAVRSFIRKKRGETNELYIINLFLYTLLVVWFNYSKFLNFINTYLDTLGNIGNYIGSVIETGFFVILQFYIYRIAITQKANLKDSMKLISMYKDNNEKMGRDVYIFLTIIVFLQASIAGLVPFFQINNYLFADIISILVLIITTIHILKIQLLIHTYSHQHLYLRTWTVFTVTTIFQNCANLLLTAFDGYFQIPIHSESTLFWVFLQVIIKYAAVVQLGCLVINLVQQHSMEDWYND